MSLGRVLIVDDDDTIADLLHVALQAHGYDTLTASNETAALVARQQRPDVVVLDLHMHPISGEQVYAQLHADPCTCGIPVLLCSAVRSAAAVAKRLNVPVILKPFPLELLERQIDELAHHKAEHLGA